MEENRNKSVIALEKSDSKGAMDRFVEVAQFTVRIEMIIIPIPLFTVL